MALKETLQVVYDGTAKKAIGATSRLGKSIKGLKPSFGGIAKASALAGVAITGAIAGATAVMVKATKAANVQEEAENKLATAMRIAGTFTNQAFGEMKKYASSLQQTTKFGDETIIKTQALLQTFGMNTEQMKQSTQAALDLSAAQGIDLKAAALLVGKAFVGETGSLSRYGIIIDKNVPKSEKFAEVMKVIGKRFGGSAQAEVATFSGKMEQVGNAYGDVLEELGFMITKNTLFIGILGKVKGAFEKLGSFIESNRLFLINLAKQGLVAIVNGFGWVVNAMANVIKVIGMVATGFVSLPEFALKAIAFIISGWEKLVNVMAKVVGVIPGIGSKMKAGLSKVSDVIENIKNGFNDTANSFGETAESIAGGTISIVNGMKNISGKVGEFANELDKIPAHYDPLNTAAKKNKDTIVLSEEEKKAKLEALKAEQAAADAEGLAQKEIETQALIDMTRGYTQAELQEYQRQKEGLFNLLNEGKITRADYTKWVAENGAKFVKTEKKTSDNFKEVWQTAWSSIKQESSAATDAILSGQKTFGTAIEDATKNTLKTILIAEADKAIASVAVKVAEQIGIASAAAPWSLGATLLMIPLITAAGVAAKAAINAAIPTFAFGGIVGMGGNRLPLSALPSAQDGATIARGRAVPILAHEGEVIGTPARLRQAGFGRGVNVTVNLNGDINTKADLDELANKIGRRVRNTIRSTL